MQDNLDDLIFDIGCDVSELHFLTKAVKDADDLYTQDPSDFNYGMVKEVIDKYEKVLRRTKIKLEAYFAEESKQGLPTDFVFRRLYKKILETED